MCIPMKFTIKKGAIILVKKKGAIINGGDEYQEYCVFVYSQGWWAS